MKSQCAELCLIGFWDPESHTMSLGCACLYLSGKVFGILGRGRAHVTANEKCEAWSSGLMLTSGWRRPKFIAKATARHAGDNLAAIHHERYLGFSSCLTAFLGDSWLPCFPCPVTWLWGVGRWQHVFLSKSFWTDTATEGAIKLFTAQWLNESYYVQARLGECTGAEDRARRERGRKNYQKMEVGWEEKWSTGKEESWK